MYVYYLYKYNIHVFYNIPKLTERSNCQDPNIFEIIRRDLNPVDREIRIINVIDQLNNIRFQEGHHIVETVHHSRQRQHDDEISLRICPCYTVERNSKSCLYIYEEN